MGASPTGPDEMRRLVRHHAKIVKLAGADRSMDPFEMSLLISSADGVSWGVDCLSKLIPKLSETDRTEAYEAICQAIRGSEIIGAIAVKGATIARSVERETRSRQQGQASKGNVVVKDEKMIVAKMFSSMNVSDALVQINQELARRHLKPISKQTLYRYRKNFILEA